MILIDGAAGASKTEPARQTRAAAERTDTLALYAKRSKLASVRLHRYTQLLALVINRPAGHGDLFAGAAGPAARRFKTAGPRSPSADIGFEALHSCTGWWSISPVRARHS